MLFTGSLAKWLLTTFHQESGGEGDTGEMLGGGEKGTSPQSQLLRPNIPDPGIPPPSSAPPAPVAS